MSIPNIYNKIKSKIDIDKVTFVYLCIIVGVGIGSFSLGRLSQNNSINKDEAITILDSNPNIKEDSLPLNPNSDILSTEIKVNKAVSNNELKRYVASKNGKLYYSLGCKAANRIKPENQVWFKSASDAENSGYKPSPSCK